MSPPRRGASPIQRLQKELGAFQKAHSSSSRDPDSIIERLGPVNDDDMFRWEAVIIGKGLGSGYDNGRWKLEIQVPQEYPNAAPRVRFGTRVVAANVNFENGEICLDLLKDNWSPAYTLEKTVEAIWQMLQNPGIDSPLNVDVAKLLHEKDYVGAESLVRWAIGEPWGRYSGC